MSKFLQNSVSDLTSKYEVHTRTIRVESSPEFRAPPGVDWPLPAPPSHQCPGHQEGAGSAVGRAGGGLQGLGQLQTPGGCVSRLSGAIGVYSSWIFTTFFKKLCLSCWTKI